MLSVSFIVILFNSVASERFTCKTIEISKSTQNLTTTIRLSLFLRENNDRFYKCVRIIGEGNSINEPEMQWMGNVQITFSRYQSVCANTTFQIIHLANGAAKLTDVRPNVIGNGNRSNVVTMKMLLDLKDGVSIFGTEN